MSNSKHSLPPIPDLSKELGHLLDQIPRGRVTTYGRVARALGDVVASRWVGEQLRDHSHDADCVCHRVVRANGDLGVYVPGSVGIKADRLREDQVVVVDGKVSLDEYLSDPLISDAPLSRLRDWQLRIGKNARREGEPNAIRYVAGIDVSYGRQSQKGVGAVALVVWDCVERRITITATRRSQIRFPYIRSYLAFRELPLMMDVLLPILQGRDHAIDVVMVDGSGVLHPRQGGIATLLGVLLDVSTVGVTKKHLVGNYDQPTLTSAGEAPVYIDGQARGTVQFPLTSSKPLFVSPGHRMDCATASRVVRDACVEHRLPEPIYWADRSSRERVNS